LNFQVLEGKKALIVVSSGGHLLEAIYLARKLKLSKSSRVITHENAQSSSILKDKPHNFVKQIISRDWFGAIMAMPKIFKIFRRENFDLILSTGAAIAVSALPASYLSRKPFYYFESLTRINYPSMTGRILERAPGVRLFSENADTFGIRWSKSPSLFDEISVGIRKLNYTQLRIFVTVGTISNYRFDRLVDCVLPILSEHDTVHWQLGSTLRSDLPGFIHQNISNIEMKRIALESDVVISHCGIGTILDLLSLGIRPLVLPRKAEFGEHIDNHQEEVVPFFQKFDLIQILSDSPSREEILVATKKFIKNPILIS
jgi:UDP-N-acetylglucosamine transferase subunit ALG13